MKKAIWVIFWVLVAYFIVLAANLAWAVPSSVGRWGIVFLTNLPLMVAALFVTLGIALIVLTFTSKVVGWLRSFLIMTGAAPIAIPIASPFLALDQETQASCIIYSIMLVFLVGIIGSIVMERRTISKSINRFGKLITTSFFLMGIGIIVFIIIAIMSSLTIWTFDVDMYAIGFTLLMVGLVIFIVGLIRRKKLGRVKQAV